MTVNAPAPLSGSMDVDEFMAFMETRPHGEDWDLIEGVAVMKAPATYVHRRLAFNLCSLLNAASDTRHVHLFAYVNVAVRNHGVRNFQAQPDVAVVPGLASYDLYSERYQLVAEVLPLSNTRDEIDLKLRRYREAPNNIYAVVMEPREFLVEIYAKSGGCQPVVLKRPDDPIEMPEFGLRCTVADLYRGTPLNPWQDS
jgi:Uma2 family endonuclease